MISSSSTDWLILLSHAIRQLRSHLMPSSQQSFNMRIPSSAFCIISATRVSTLWCRMETLPNTLASTLNLRRWGSQRALKSDGSDYASITTSKQISHRLWSKTRSPLAWCNYNVKLHSRSKLSQLCMQSNSSMKTINCLWVLASSTTLRRRRVISTLRRVNALLELSPELRNAMLNRLSIETSNWYWHSLYEMVANNYLFINL